MKTKYVEPGAYFSKDMQKAFKQASKKTSESKKKTATKGTVKKK